MPPSALDDPNQPPHHRDVVVPELAPYSMVLKDEKTSAIMYPFPPNVDVPMGLMEFLHDEFNTEILRGDTLPFFDPVDFASFQNYWFGAFAGVLLIGDKPVDLHSAQREWAKECLGTFFIKPNYPGRCSHVCTAGFLVNHVIRRQGIGRQLVKGFLDWAPKLGYSYSMFNLVFESNVAAINIFETMSFTRLGRIQGAGILKGHETAVDAFMYGRQLIDAPDDGSLGEERFDRIKYYLENGTYPIDSDRSEKSRLRSSAAHYRLENGRLYLKGREVVGDPDRQLQIATEIHANGHPGINKTTSQITEKYHWTRIKETVAQALHNCNECRESSRPPVKRAKHSHNSSSHTHETSYNSSYDPHHQHHHQQQHAGPATAHSAHHDGLLPTELGLEDGLMAPLRNDHSHDQQRKDDGQGNHHQPTHHGRAHTENVDPQIGFGDDEADHEGDGNNTDLAMAQALMQANNESTNT